MDEPIERLAKNIYYLMDKFVKQYLTAENKDELYYGLTVVVKKLNGPSRSAGRCTIKRNYLRPVLKIYEKNLHDTWSEGSKGLVKRQFELFVLFHELAHVVEQLNDIPKYKHTFTNGKQVIIKDDSVEHWCNNVAWDFLKENGIIDSIEFLDWSLTQEPENANIYATKAFKLYFDGSSQKALPQLNKAIKLYNPRQCGGDQLHYLYLIKGQVLDDLGQFDEAIKCFEASLGELQKVGGFVHDLVNLYLSWGNTCCHMERFEEAVSLCEKGLELNTDYDLELNDLRMEAESKLGL